MIVRVVNIRDYIGPGSKNEPKYRQYIYVGRANRTARLKGHPLANPFKVKSRAATHNERVECIAKYRQWLREHPQRFELLAKLKADIEASGLPLACWCCEWDGNNSEPGTPCHAVVLAKILMGRE